MELINILFMILTFVDKFIVDYLLQLLQRKRSAMAGVCLDVLMTRRKICRQLWLLLSIFCDGNRRLSFELLMNLWICLLL